MKIKGIGINAHPDHTGGEIEVLAQDLKFFEEIGYDYVEIPVDAVDVIRCGELDGRLFQKLKKLLNNFDLKYTVHAPNALDLRDRENSEVQMKLFQACIDFTAEIGANIFVYHFNRSTEDKTIEEHLKKCISEMADYAESKGVLICVENIEIDTVENVVDFVRVVNKKSVAMTLDLAHAFLASRRFGFDFLGSIKLAKPYVRHIHVHDNFGKFEEARLAGYEVYKRIPYRKLLALGKGDLHLPPGWGTLPFDKVFEILEDYEGVFMLEYYYHRYRPQAREIFETVKTLVRRYETP